MYTANQSGATSSSSTNMDAAESDDSERWEDFYGSSTDLTPALLRIYDSLNIAFEAKHNKNKAAAAAAANNKKSNNLKQQQNEKKLTSFSHTLDNEQHHQQKYDISPVGSTYSLKSCASSLHRSSMRNGHTSEHGGSNGSLNSNNNANNKHRNNIKFLSPNVQRLIIHSDAEHVDTIAMEALQQSPEKIYDEQQPLTISSSSSKLSPRFTKKVLSHTVSHHGQRSKLSNIPLSKVTCQLTAAGNELVSTFDSSGEYLNALSSPTHISNENVNIVTDDDEVDGIRDDDGDDDNEKTPTNGAKPFIYDFRPSTLQHQQSIKFIELEKLATTTQLLSSLSLSRSHSQQSKSNHRVSDHVNVDDFMVPTNVVENFGDHHDDELSGIMEAINTSLVNMQQVLQFNKSKKNSSCDTVSESAASVSSISLKPEQALEIGSTESLDRPTEMKFNAQKSYSLMLPEIAKLKHRPLSSSSLCSTSSSSSSGSDNLNSKLNLNISYLASVESLADHSEPELGMTILERASLEIFESERNYVEDLRQVITGYLSDWKERACLRIDELQTLFSNIEEIYEFSSKLLNLLNEAGMDPVKIAKCFISMRDDFDVYTKYCTSYPEAISLLTKLLQATHTNSLLASTQKRLQHTLPLGSYLLKPVQRILKYHLLLDNLRKHCDVKEVTQAYEIMRQVARHIDQVKRRLEQQSRVKELSGILDGWLGPELTVLGELRLEGLLMEHNKPRIVLLFATMLIITKPKEDNRLIFKSLINQNNLMLNEHLPGEPTSFYVIPYDNPRNQIKLSAKNRDQKRVWTQHIKEAMLERFGNIPNRAKELVFKLGDEDDHNSNKNTTTRKWTINSASVTPTYLERRNQYRRSELRKRSKQKRKTVTDLSSIEAEAEKEAAAAAAEKPTKLLTRNNSIDDSMVPRLLRLATAVRNRSSQQPPTLSVSQEILDTNDNSFDVDDEEAGNCECKTNKNNKSTTRERSKSVPKINFQQQEDINENKTEMQKQNVVSKRTTPLKKQRNTTKRDTFKFYMDISEFDQSDESTVLKITESTENVNKIQLEVVKENEDKVLHEIQTEEEYLNENKQIKIEETNNKNSKNEAQIVQELLKDSKEFEKLYKKSQRKRSTEVNPKNNENDLEILKKIATRERAPTPPSTSPPLLNNEAVEAEKQTKEALEDVDEEPIYESLLRNVHVPYKFSPDFKRSKSLQNYTRREKKETSKQQRPESDYVMLKYTEEGLLLQVGQERVSTNSATSQKTLINEPTREKTNQEIKETEVEAPKPKPRPVQAPAAVINKSNANLNNTPNLKPKNLVRRLFVTQSSNSSSGGSGGGGRMSSLENISNALLSRKSRRKSIDTYGCSNKPPERRVSDVTEMCRLSILQRQQGSQAVGERMASVDYADPRTLFNFNQSLPCNQLLRDSVVSLTSSSDSVHGCSNNRFGGKHSSSELATNFEYEDDVEASLEQNFRDSAIYSDDNERRTEVVSQNEESKLKKRKSGAPPQLPPKPPNLKALLASSPAPSPAPGVVICPPHMNKAASRSWVLQQIENFSK